MKHLRPRRWPKGSLDRLRRAAPLSAAIALALLVAAGSLLAGTGSASAADPSTACVAGKAFTVQGSQSQGNFKQDPCTSSSSTQTGGQTTTIPGQSGGSFSNGGGATTTVQQQVVQQQVVQQIVVQQQVVQQQVVQQQVQPAFVQQAQPVVVKQQQSPKPAIVQQEVFAANDHFNAIAVTTVAGEPFIFVPDGPDHKDPKFDARCNGPADVPVNVNGVLVPWLDWANTHCSLNHCPNHPTANGCIEYDCNSRWADDFCVVHDCRGNWWNDSCHGDFCDRDWDSNWNNNHMSWNDWSNRCHVDFCHDGKWDARHMSWDDWDHHCKDFDPCDDGHHFNNVSWNGHDNDWDRNGNWNRNGNWDRDWDRDHDRDHHNNHKVHNVNFNCQPVVVVVKTVTVVTQAPVTVVSARPTTVSPVAGSFVPPKSGDGGLLDSRSGSEQSRNQLGFAALALISFFSLGGIMLTRRVGR